MTTFADLIADVEADLYSFTQGNDQVSWLTSALASTDTAIQVNDAAQFGVGYAEITSTAGNELVYISSKDEQTNTLTVPPWGRAQRGTSAYTHPINARIAASPQFPRYKIAQFVNEALTDSYPSVFVADYTDIPLDRHIQVYDMPLECDGLLDAQVSSDTSPEHGWRELRRMKFNANLRTLDIAGAARDGYTLRVTYRRAPDALVNLTDTLDAIGYGDYMRSTLRQFAYYKALNSLQGQNLTISAVESSAMVQLRQPDYLNNAIKSAFAQYQVALQQQEDRLRQQYPPMRYRLP